MKKSLVALLFCISISHAPGQSNSISTTGGQTLTAPLKSTSSITARLLGAHMLADQFNGADASAKINACLAAAKAAGSSVCDARMFNGNQTMSQTIEVLEGTELMLPRKADWCWGFTDGASVGIQQDSSSSVTGSSTGGGGGNMLLTPCNSSTRMLALYATQNNPVSGGQYVFANGFVAMNTQGASFSHGVIYTRYLFDESRYERVAAINPNGDAWHILSVCCDTNYQEVSADSSYGSTGGTPLVVEGAAAFSWSGTINAAGTGHPNIDVQSGNYQLDFWNTYAETNGPQADTATPVVNIAGTPTLRFHGGVVNMDSFKPCFSNPGLVAVNNGWCNAPVPAEGAACSSNGSFFGTDSNYLYVCAGNQVRRAQLN